MIYSFLEVPDTLSSRDSPSYLLVIYLYLFRKKFAASKFHSTCHGQLVNLCFGEKSIWISCLSPISSISLFFPRPDWQEMHLIKLLRPRFVKLGKVKKKGSEFFWLNGGKCHFPFLPHQKNSRNYEIVTRSISFVKGGEMQEVVCRQLPWLIGLWLFVFFWVRPCQYNLDPFYIFPIIL